MNSNQGTHAVHNRLIPGGMRRLLGHQQTAIALVAVGLALFFTIDSKYFATGTNEATLSGFIAPIAFFALAEVPILILGEIDLSVGWPWSRRC
jgi:simple sugar transport system permease protein